MRLKIKVLKGGECEVQVSEEATVFDVKEEVARTLGIPTDQQRLMNRGRALTDTSMLADCDVEDNSKLYVSVKAGNTTDTSASNSSSSVPSSAKLDFWKELGTFYASHFNEQESQQLLESFQRELSMITRMLSLDDIERISAAYLSDTS